MFKVPTTNRVPYSEKAISDVVRDTDKFLQYMKALIRAIQDKLYGELANGINNNAGLVTGYREAVDNDDTPDVKNCLFLIVNYSSGTSVTNFDNGEEGQRLDVLQVSGAGTVTLVDGTTIKTNTDANKAMTKERVYSFRMYGGVWYEVA